MKLIYSIICVLVLASCASMNRNQLYTGSVIFNGGVYKDINWDEKLILKRFSWYRELSLSFDVYITKISKESAFYNWFSDHEKKRIDTCSQFYVLATYSLQDKGATQKEFISEMIKNGLTEVAIMDFARNFKAHPDYLRSTIVSYKIYGLCSKDPMLKNGLYVTLPGFKEIKMEI